MIYFRSFTAALLFSMALLLAVPQDVEAGFSKPGSTTAGSAYRTGSTSGTGSGAGLDEDAGTPPRSAATAQPDPAASAADAVVDAAVGEDDSGAAPAESAAGTASPSTTDYWAHFLKLFDVTCPYTPPFPMNFIGEDVDFTRGDEKGSIQIVVKGTEDLLEEFTVPEVLDSENLRSYFVALKMAAVEKNLDALRVHARFRALLKDLGRVDLLQKLESAPLPPEALVENFPAWVASLRGRFVEPFEGDSVGFVKEHTDNLEWMETVFRGWFLLADGAEVTAAQAATLIGSAVDLGEFLSAFTVELFTLFEDDKMGAWEKEFFPKPEEAAGGDAEASSAAASGLGFTPEENRAHVRRRMLTSHQMIMQAYLTVEDLLGSLKIETPPNTGGWDEVVYQGHKDASDLQMNILMLKVFETFYKGPHFNPQFIKSQIGIHEFTCVYETFMSSMLESTLVQGIKVVGHKLFQTKKELALPEEILKDRLTAKGKLLKGEVLPIAEVTSAWFDSLVKGHSMRLSQLQIPEDLTPDSLGVLRVRQESLREELRIIGMKAQKWKQTSQVLTRRLGEIEAQRLELGLEPLPDLDEGK